MPDRGKIKRTLLKTGDSILAEASPYDDIFGIRLSSDAATTTEPNQWLGRNLLGKALMEVRTELRGGADVAGAHSVFKGYGFASTA